MTTRKPATQPLFAVHLLSMPIGRVSWDDIERTTTHHASTKTVAARLCALLADADVDAIAADASLEPSIEAIADALCDGLDRGFGSEPFVWERHGRVFRLDVEFVRIDA